MNHSFWPATSLRCVLVLLITSAGFAQDAPPATSELPRLREQGGVTQLIVDGKPFLVLGGELHNSSASSLDHMELIWPRLTKLNLNTVLATVSWELLEPEEGKFDFTLVDGLIRQARANNLRLVFLWFASWKNGESSYVPGWVKHDPQRFPRVKRSGGGGADVLTPLGVNSMKADAKAFAALMRRIREIDGEHRTVIMVQVQNEPGLLGDSRDRSPLAEAAFAQPVPKELIAHLTARKASLTPELLKMWESKGFQTQGNWSAVFGDGADEAFMAWHVARYVGEVAAQGKAEYALPMFANAWLAHSPTDTLTTEMQAFTGGRKPGQYPSGGPVSKMMDVWRAAAPKIDFISPDIYLPNFKRIVADYARPGNPLMIPEAARDNAAAAKAFYAFGQHAAIGFSPFGIDSVAANHPIAEAYQALASLAPLILANQGAGKVAGVLQDFDREENKKQSLRLGNYNLSIHFDGNDKSKPGYAIAIATGPDEYVFAGAGCVIYFSSLDPNLKSTSVLSIDEGRFEAGRWIPGRRINGDESNHNSRFALPGSTAAIRRVRLYHPGVAQDPTARSAP